MFENIHENHNFLVNALRLKGSVTPRVLHRVFLIAIYANLISILNYYYSELLLPIGPFEYGGLIMGLILVFRVNSGYDRWWEARKLWGNITNHSRNLAMSLYQYTEPKDNEWLKKISGYLIAFPYLMKSHLRQVSETEMIKPFLDQESFSQVSSAKKPVLALSNLVAAELQSARNKNLLDPFAFLRAEETRSLLVDSLGGCERILNTPMPFVMAVKSRRFILFFLLMLPFALIHVSNIYISPIISALVAYALFALDQIGVELQNPFSESNLSHLPLSKICDTIKEDIESLSPITLDYPPKS